ncbi:hypothetical protein [Virgibacillus kimchii]
MRKYWKSISIAIITMVTIGSFYIQSAFAGSNYPEFMMETLHGDEAEVKNLTLYGDYRIENIKGDNFQITAEGTQYYSESSYLDRLHGRNMSQEMEELQKDYKSFMRGKLRESQLAENEVNAVYADVSSNTDRDKEFQVEILDKDSGGTTEFSADVPDGEKYSFIHVEQVHIVGDQIKLLTNNYVNGTSEGFATEIHVYDFDMNQKSLVHNEEIISYKDGTADQTMTSVYIPEGGSSLKSNSYAVFILEEWETGEDGEGIHYTDLSKSRVVSIHVETNEYAEFELPDEFQDLANTVKLEGSSLYFIDSSASGFEIMVYDLENQELDESRSLTIEQDNVDMHMGQPLTAIKDGKIYIVSYTDEEYIQANILVVDVQTGELVYEGQVKGNGGDTNDYTFHLFDMVIH